MKEKKKSGCPLPKECSEFQMPQQMSKENDHRIGVAFDPMKASKRTVTYLKVNECDH